MNAVEERRRAEGAPPRDIEAIYGGWRQTASPRNLALMSFYAEYSLCSQFAGMGSALSLDAIRTAIEIEGIPRNHWAPLTKRILRLHELVMLHVQKTKKTSST